MTIHIRSIQVEKLGPLESLQETLKKVNLFYGMNESGKTYLVEFLVRSLFEQTRHWGLREPSGQGSVFVEGLAQESVPFRPHSTRKIESYWDRDDIGLPVNLARLLVVKGGELDLSPGSPGGVDRDALKLALTGQALLDQIWNSIPATIHKATLEGSLIVGSNRGLIKNRAEIQEEIHELETLLKQIENRYSLAPVRELEKDLETAQVKLVNQQNAKRAEAYQTSQCLEELLEQREAFREKDIQDLRDAIRDLDSFELDIRTLKEKTSDDEIKSKEYPWLEQAITIWEEKGLDKKKSPQKTLGIAGIVLLGMGASLLILENLIAQPDLVWLGSGIAGLGFAISLYFGIKLLRWGSHLQDSREREAIRGEFEQKFNAPLRSLADLKTYQSKLQAVYLTAQTRQSDLKEKNDQRREKSLAIKASFTGFLGETPAEMEWKEALANLIKKSEQLNHDILEKKLHLSSLNISEDAYYEGPIKTEYDQDILQALEKEIQDLTDNLGDLQADLETLKSRACERTGDELTKPWTEVLYNLQSLLEERIHEYQELTADLVAQIGLVEVLTRLRDEEDQKIIKAINTDSVSSLLQQITGRYQKLDLADEQIFVHDSFGRYALSDLSTGAREQVQLALRLGLASQLCGGDPLFLILDDAFQHSDWLRREALVDSCLNLAHSGWQILYLSMDDHIRDLFIKKAKPSLSKEFKLIQLN